MAFPHGKATTAELLGEVNQHMLAAASRGDYKEVQRLARIAEELSVLAKREEEIAQSLENLAAMIKDPLESGIDRDQISARERGNKVRQHYAGYVLPKQEIHLEQITPKKYRTPDRRVVGITYAKELESRPSLWFLGLSDEHFDWVILLCESSDKTGAEIAALLLPPEFVKQIWKSLSRSKGQVKFHVARTGYMNFELRLPGAQQLNISKYLNATQSLTKSKLER